MSSNLEVDVGARRLRLMVSYCGHLYGLMPTSELVVIENDRAGRLSGSIDVPKIATEIGLDIVDDLIELPSIPNAAARKITAGLSRLNQIEGVDSYRTLFDLLGTSPTDSAETQDRARSKALTANSRRRFSDPRKSIIGELLSYCRTFLSANDSDGYICFAAKDLLEPLCTVLVASGICGSPLREELVAAARRYGMTQTLGTVLALQLIKAETGGLTTALQMGFSVCAPCGHEKMSVMRCPCRDSGSNSDTRFHAPNTEMGDGNSSQVNWNRLMDSGASALRQITLKMTTPQGLFRFQYTRIREAPTGAVQLLLDAQNPNNIFEFRTGERYEHPSNLWNIAVQFDLDSRSVHFSGALPDFVVSLDGVPQNKWLEVVGVDEHILPIRLMKSSNRRFPRACGSSATESKGFLNTLLESFGGANYIYGRWLQ